MKPNIPRIIIADDHEMFRDALKTMLELEEIAEVIAEAADGKALLRHLESVQPDIILLDIDMPLLNGIETAKEITGLYPDIRILTLSMYGDERYYKEMIEAGAKGFLLKSANKSELETAIKSVYNGQAYFSNELLRNLVESIGKKETKLEKSEDEVYFTQRETELLELLCKGMSTQEIADTLFLSAKTVENYRGRLLQKTGCRNAVELAVYAITNKIIELS